MQTQTIPIKKGRLFTKENAKLIGSLGGRPKGVLDKKTLAKMKDKQAIEKVILERAGKVVDNLLISSNLLDTTASIHLLDRALGKIPQGVNLQAVQFSLKELAEYRKGLQNPPAENAVIPQIAMLDALKDDTEKKT